MDPNEAIEKLAAWNETCHRLLGEPTDGNVDQRRHLMQSDEELRGFCAVIERILPKNICLEVGLYRGGTHFLWQQYFSKVISIEINQKFCDEARRVLNACGIGLDDSVMICADAHSVAGIPEVDAALSGRQIDMLFIDGNHTYESVKADFESYQGRVRVGGIVAFHDAGSREHMPGTYQAIEEIERDREKFGLSKQQIVYHEYAGIGWFSKEGEGA